MNMIPLSMTTVQEGGFTYLRVPLTFPWFFYIAMMTSLIVLMAVFLIMVWSKKK